MRWSATRARWVLLGGAVLLAMTVAAFFGVARYRAGRIWQRILARNGVHVTRESNGITWSQSNKERTLFTVHASKAVPQGNNKWLLHDAVLILYGTRPGHDDRIYGSEFQYDQEQGIARAMGEVHLDLQAPEPGGKAPLAGSRPSLDFGSEHESATDPGLIHVRTSGLVYMRKMGIAATGEPAEFRYRGMTCTSRGAEFDTEHGVLRLLADVRLSGQMKEAPFSLAATQATMDRSGNTADLQAPSLVSGTRNARASHTLLHFRKDGSLETAEADGAVQLRSGTQSLQAPLLNASFGSQSDPEHAHLSSGVSFSDTGATAPAHGTAKTLDLAWAKPGVLQQAAAAGAVQFAQHVVSNGVSTGEREMHAEQAVATFAAAGFRRVNLQQVRLTGAGEVRSVTSGRAGRGSGEERTSSEVRVAGDELLTSFGVGPEGRPLAQSLVGRGHTRLEQAGADGGHQTGTGDELTMIFAPSAANGTRTGDLDVSSAVQTGHVDILSWPAALPVGKTQTTAATPSTGRAARAAYAAADGTLVLTGAPSQRAELRGNGAEVTADTVTLHQGTGDAEAQGHVVATSMGTPDAAATHIVAARGRLLHSVDLAEFFGEDSHPAQLFQGGSSVSAATITLDSANHRLTARPLADGGSIHALFATTGKPAGEGVGTLRGERAGTRAGGAPDPLLGRPGGMGVADAKVPQAERGTVTVSAARMDYDDIGRQAVFAGNVHLTGVAGAATADRAVAFLHAPTGKGTGTSEYGAAPNLGGDLERMVLGGDVHLRQPGRTGEGEELVYTTATGSFALTGTAAKPPRMTGEQGTLVTGATLLFRSADNTVVMAGAPATSKEVKPARVHTERDLKQ